MAVKDPKVAKSRRYTVFGLYSREALAYPWLFTFTVGGMVISQVAELISPLYLKQLFNTLVTAHPDAAIVHALIITLILIAVFYLIDWAASRILYFALIHAEAKIAANLYERAFGYLIEHSYQFFSSQFSGTLTRRVGKFATAFENLYDTIMMQFAPTAIFVTGAVTILFIRNHVLGAALGIWALVFVVFQVYVANLQRPLREASSAEDSRLTGAIADAITNQNNISLFAGSPFERLRFSEIVQGWHKIRLRSWTANEYIWTAIAFFIVVVNIGLLGGAIYFWQRGQLTIGDFVLIQAYLLTTVQQLAGIGRNLRRFYDSYTDAGEMINIFNTPYGVQDPPDARTLSVTSGTIAFKDVEYYFNPDRPILTDFNLSVAGGEKIALVGPSGAGKSTITRLLLRFYDVRGGSIEIDGQDIRNVTQDSLREAISFVPQEPILFHRSLMENIRYGKRDATDDEVLEAAKKAHCHEFISAFPDGYETFVGERGVKLSGGERQRVAIARAILKNAPILVLDEATSSLDSESESLIQDALQTLMQGKTVIVIAHRLSTIMRMDRIVVIEAGAIAAQGTHDELLNDESGLYHKLWSIQAGGFVVDEKEEGN